MKNIKKYRAFYFCIILLTLSNYGLCQSYDREAAAEYAELWWDTDEDYYNTDFDYHVGNNCANFVSQCIMAGGYNLNEGTDGNGSNVDSHGAIVNCDWLHLHLYNYKINDQNNDYERLSDPNEPGWMEKGDIAIFGNSSDYWEHAVFAVTGESGSNITYNANTENRQHEPVTWFYTSTWPSCDFYHIKDYMEPPMFCYNCLWDIDEGETAGDCGGPCPPCETAPDYKYYTEPTNNLPEETFAVQEITVDVTGNNKITVEPNQNVSFNAGETIKLKPGFHAKSNSNFKAATSINNYELTRSCEQFCVPDWLFTFTRPCGYELHLINFEYYHIQIEQYCSGYFIPIYESSGTISSNGLFCNPCQIHSLPIQEFLLLFLLRIKYYQYKFCHYHKP